MAETFNRAKKKRPEMLPVKRWLSKQEAMAYLDVSVNVFQQLVSEAGLTVTTLREGGAKTYYKVSELDSLFEKNIIQKKVS